MPFATKTKKIPALLLFVFTVLFLRGGTHDGAQGFLLALHLGITSVGVWGIICGARGLNGSWPYLRQAPYRLCYCFGSNVPLLIYKIGIIVELISLSL